ncbi:uncharacterized protein F4822DRAFT_377597 [Hypoxylon trugodes]|uniref:uncharacterized protein n=1 Tax=Hypoxylon trugodes TaxID=326681 RepID=UPI00219A5BDF|nr:uncharacterized protein F4822DRAFT_377597 [Hypoxylon trugodes]KAI1384922.1 hypothetical protein F4822DRAFT_377597 [Hypoxylon trugodes]
MRLSLLAILTCIAGLTTPSPLSPPSNNNTTTQELKGMIPVTSIECTASDLEPDATRKARAELVKWGEDHMVPPKCLRRAEVRDTVWYVCNCKLTYADPLPKDELQKAEELLFKKCGPFRSGAVWSREWDKMYKILPTEVVANVTFPAEMCPPGCVFQEC